MGEIKLMGNDASHKDGWLLHRIHDSDRVFKELAALVRVFLFSACRLFENTLSLLC